MTSSSSPGAGDASAQMRRLGIGNPLGVLGVAAAGYIGALIVGIVVVLIMVFGIGAANIDSSVSSTTGIPMGDDGGSSDSSGIGYILRMPFQIVAMGLLGSLHLATGISRDGQDIAAGLRMIPFAVPLALALICYVGSRLVSRRISSGRVLGAVIASGLGGLLVAIVTVLAARIAALELGESDYLTVSIHAAGVDAFLGAFLVTFVALLLGQLAALPRPAWWPLVADLAAAARLFMLHAIVLAAVIGAWLWICLLVKSLMDGDGSPALSVLAASPFLMGQIIAFCMGGFLLGGAATVSVSGEAGMLGDVGMVKTYMMFDLPWYVWLGAFILSLVVLAMMSLLWGSGRRIVPGNTVAVAVSWAALPVAYFIGGIALLIMAYTSLHMDLAAVSSIAGAASLSLAPWVILLLAVVGVIIEVLSRFVAPLVTPLLPTWLFDWFRTPPAILRRGGSTLPSAVGATGTPGAVALGDGPIDFAISQSGSSALPPVGFQAPVATIPLGGAVAYGYVDGQDSAAPAPGVASAPSTATAPGAPSATSASAQTSAASAPSATTASAPSATEWTPVGTEQQGQPLGQRAPMSRRTKRRVLLGLGAAGTALLLVIAAGIGYAVLSSKVFGPQAQVDEYLSALESGNFGQAAELAPPNVPTAQRALLTDAVGAKVTHRVQSHSIDDVDVSGKTAEVTVTLTQDGVRSNRTYSLVRKGSSYGIFPDWQMDDPGYDTMQVYVPTGIGEITVNGVAVKLDGAVETDEAEGYSNASLAVLPGGYSIGATSTSGDFEIQPADEITVSADQAKNQDGLIAALSSTITDAGRKKVQDAVKAKLDECAQQTSSSPSGCPFSAYTSESGTWKIDTYPEIQVDDSEGGIMFSASTAGHVAFSYTETAWDGSTQKQTVDGDFSPSGYAAFAADGTVTVQFS